MSDFGVQLALVGVVLASVVGVVAFLSVRRRAPRRTLETGGLAPGIYLFTSETCLGCASAREVLEAHLGPRGYREVRWELDPETFESIPVDEVPVTIVVPESGSAVLWRGDPSRMFSDSNA